VIAIIILIFLLIVSSYYKVPSKILNRIGIAQYSIHWIVFVGISTIVLIKPVFNIFAYFVAFIFFNFLIGKSERIYRLEEPAAVNNKKYSLSLKYKIIKSLGRYINGLIFYSMIQTGRISFHATRNIIYRDVFKIKMGKNVIIYGGVEIRGSNRLIIGKGSIIGHHSVLDARNTIEIGENVNFSHGVWLWTEQHNYNNSDFSCVSSKKKMIKIYDRVWLGPRVIVLPGCTIGEGAVVGAGAIVTKDIEPYTINVGIPARKVGERNKDLTYVFDGKPIPFI
jgi:acetyltransferase-like isoleucine patch superfamily enzyme